MPNEISFALQYGCITLLSLVVLFFIKNLRHDRNGWAGISFTLSIICYMLADSSFSNHYDFMAIIFVTGAISAPVFFWLMSKAIFEDHFRISLSIVVWIIVQLTLHFGSFSVRGSYEFSRTAATLLYLLPQLLSISFVLAGLYTAVQTREADLIPARIHFRKIFLFGTAALIGLTIIVEIATFGEDAPAVLQTFQRLGVLALTAWFLLANLEVRPGFFFRPGAKTTDLSDEDPVLEGKLQSLIDQNKIYRTEGLSIRQLAGMMNEQEYRIRRMINGRMGFRNFNDFLNQHRIREACDIFSDPGQDRKTVLEVAYQLGYQSIGPFNKAFKELAGTTPTEYRKERKKNNPS